MPLRHGRIAAASSTSAIEVARAPRPTLVFLHEGLGSIAMWRDFPGRVAHATDCNALVYSRYGYGQSDPLAEARTVRYMHDEALTALPELLDALAIDRPILVGHSDGGSIALILAGAGLRPLTGVVTLAAHVMVEDVSVASIAAAKIAYETTEPAREARPLPRRRRFGVPGLEPDLARAGVPRLEHRGVSAAHRLPGARDPGRGRRIRNDGAAAPHRRAGARRRVAGAAGLPPLGAQGSARGRDRGDHALRRSRHTMMGTIGTRTLRQHCATAQGRHSVLRSRRLAVLPRRGRA